MYTIHDLGPLSHPMAVNDAGQVVGYTDVGNTAHHAFFWDSGDMIDLDDNWKPHTEAAFSVSKDGQVVGGTSLVSDTKAAGPAFFCREPLAKNPTLLPLDTVTSIARGINKLGAIAGQRQLPGEAWQPVYWPSYQDPPTLLASTQPGLGGKAGAINEHGVIVGRATIDNVGNIGNFVGCLWKTFEDPPRHWTLRPGFLRVMRGPSATMARGRETPGPARWESTGPEWLTGSTPWRLHCRRQSRRFATLAAGTRSRTRANGSTQSSPFFQAWSLASASPSTKKEMWSARSLIPSLLTPKTS